MLKQSLLLPLFLLVFSLAYTQGTLKIKTTPKDAIITVDGKIVNDGKTKKQPYFVPVTIGNHTVQVSREYFVTETIEVDVKDSKPVLVEVGLNVLDPDFRTFLDKRQYYYEKRNSRIFNLSALGIPALSAWTYVALTGRKKERELKEMAEEAADNYQEEIIIPRIQALETEYKRLSEAYVEEQKKSNKRKKIVGGIASGFTLATAALLVHYSRNKLKKPSYVPKTSLSFVPNETYWYGIGLGIHYNF